MATIAHVDFITFLVVLGRSQSVPIFIKFHITLDPKSTETLLNTSLRL